MVHIHHGSPRRSSDPVDRTSTKRKRQLGYIDTHRHDSCVRVHSKSKIFIQVSRAGSNRCGSQLRSECIDHGIHPCRKATPFTCKCDPPAVAVPPFSRRTYILASIASTWETIVSWLSFPLR